ncbi:MAG: formate/nitrite transporter family protein, partial [Firmicutes bacterium]|nr:formate/nitrite transporter family protein [Bacillota bacterium]
MENKPLKPAETLEVCINTGVAKAGSSFGRLVVLGILAGAFIALAAQGSTMAAFNLIGSPETFGVGKALQGAVFGAGLIMVVLAGGELFTGNVLILASVAEKKVTVAKMLRNWVIVYIANLIGSLLVAWLVSQTGQWAGGADALGGMTVKIAAGKTALDFWPALVMGIFCNWLVCVAVWLAFASESFIGKIFGIFFPIWLFVLSGFEHSIANMYYIPAGIFAKANEAFVAASGAAPEALSSLTWGGFFISNLIPVTIGNILGGGIFVAMAYWYS